MALPVTLKGVSQKLINKFGNDLTLKQVTQGAYDPATGTTSDTVATIATKAVHEEQRGEHGGTGDLVLTFYSATAIDAFDKATYLGREREIISIQKIAAQNTTTLYQAVVTGDAKRQV